MFGPIMRFTTRTGLEVELAPLASSDMPQFVVSGGMQSEIVTRFLGRQTAPTIEDEVEFFDKVRKDSTCVSWGIYAIVDGVRTLIGTSALHGIDSKEYDPFKIATSGFMIFRPEFWGKGIAGAAHCARTMFAFDLLGIVVIRSSVTIGNDASLRALQSVGYVIHHTDRKPGLNNGTPRVNNELWCVNPDKYTWNYFWRDARLADEWYEARKRSGLALRWAHDNVEFL